MSESSYLRLASPTRLSNYLGLEMVEGYQFTYPKESERNYAYIEIPLHSAVSAAAGAAEAALEGKAMRNQYVRMMPACSVEVRGNYRFEVHPNRALAEYGIVQAPYYLEPKEGRLVPYFYLQLRKDLELSTVDYAIRIYMRS